MGNFLCFVAGAVLGIQGYRFYVSFARYKYNGMTLRQRALVALTEL